MIQTQKQMLERFGKLVQFSDMPYLTCPSNWYGKTKVNGFNQMRKHDYYKNKKWI